MFNRKKKIEVDAPALVEPSEEHLPAPSYEFTTAASFVEASGPEHNQRLRWDDSLVGRFRNRQFDSLEDIIGGIQNSYLSECIKEQSIRWAMSVPTGKLFQRRALDGIQRTLYNLLDRAETSGLWYETDVEGDVLYNRLVNTHAVVIRRIRLEREDRIVGIVLNSTIGILSLLLLYLIGYELIKARDPLNSLRDEMVTSFDETRRFLQSGIPGISEELLRDRIGKDGSSYLVFQKNNTGFKIIGYTLKNSRMICETPDSWNRIPVKDIRAEQIRCKVNKPVSEP